MLMVIVMITGDFLDMSLTTDNVSPSEKPNSWQIGRITGAAAILAACFLSFCLTILLVGKFKVGLGVEALRTLSVVAIVYGSQATIYAIRDRHHFWGLLPTVWLLLSRSPTFLSSLRWPPGFRHGLAAFIDSAL
jgi:H+-transporting ATPase